MGIGSGAASLAFELKEVLNAAHALVRTTAGCGSLAHAHVSAARRGSRNVGMRDVLCGQVCVWAFASVRASGVCVRAVYISVCVRACVRERDFLKAANAEGKRAIFSSGARRPFVPLPGGCVSADS